MNLANAFPLKRRVDQLKVFRGVPESAALPPVELLAWQVRDWVAYCLGFPADFRQFWNEVVRLAAGKQIEDYQQSGEELERLFGLYSQAIADARAMVGLLQAHYGLKAEGGDQLDGLEREIRELHAETLGRWPWPPTAAEVSAAREEDRHGDATPLDESFARIAGVSKEAWLEKVDQYAKARK